MIQNKKLLYLLSGFTVVYVLLSIIGLFNNYSAVPFWDMWDGYLDFYVKVTNGDWHAWFAQHNEHRTIFSNLLFFIDIHFFGGKSIFLLIANFTLMASIGWLVLAIIKDIFTDKTNESISHHLLWIGSLFSIVMIFSWIQENNIVWGFQSQFFAAYFFPLLSFYLLVKSVQNNNTWHYIVALLAGIISAGTMANGVMALPILLLLSLLLKNHFLKSIVIFITSLGVLYLYFSDYHAPVGHGSLSDTLINHPKEFFQYIFAYLGGIFYYIFGKRSHSIPQFFGFTMILTSLFFTYVALIKKNSNRYYYVILGYLLYYGGTAFGTAGGRVIFGLDQAFASRYMTPSLIAWSLLLVVLLHYFKNNKKIVNILLAFIVIICITLSVFQLQVFKNQSDSLFDRKVAIVALEMGIRDESYIKNIFPFVDWIITMAQEPIHRNLSIFGHDSIKDVGLMMGQTIQTLPKNNFIGHIDEITTIQEDSKALRFKGWIFDQDLQQIPNKLFVLNQKNKIIGYLLVGSSRNDVSESIHKKALKSGYIGYCFKADISDDIYLVDIISNKKLPLDIRGQYESK